MLPVSVHSHRRSGTYLLLNTLFENFRFNTNTALEVTVPNAKWEGKDQDTVEVPYARLIGTHDPFSDAFNPEKVLYIFRNPLSVLISLYKGIDGGVREESFEDWFIENDVIKHWVDHVTGYVQSGCFYIKYEDICIDSPNFERTMEMIKARYDLDPKNENFYPVSRPVGWMPNINKKVDKSSYLTQKIVDICVETIPKNFMGYQAINMWGLL